RVYGVPRNRIHPANPRKPAFAVAVDVASAVASAGAGRSPAEPQHPVLATVIIPVHTSLPI
ncbi:hypothetical protein N7676_19865, partial [Stenotrophomonas sp. GD03993]|uniref:hypothetical protein n=1 Tax=Stenotrophomonas sp. GD03993 TaxID=2975416 RepID=UPI002447F201